MSSKADFWIWLAFGIFSSLFLFTSGGRLFFPYQLEWMEGEILIYVYRLSTQQNLYTEPTFEWTPFLYNFLYFYVTYAVDYLFSNGLISGRLISIISTIGTCFLLCLVVNKITSKLVYGVLACTIYLASYVPSGAWMDLARVDSLFLFFTSISIFGLFDKSRFRAPLLVLMGLVGSFLVKQSALTMFPFFCCAFFIHRPKTAIYIAILLFIAIAGVTYVGNLITDGWYAYYIFQLAAEHKWITYRYWSFFTHDLGGWFAPAIVVSLLGCREKGYKNTASLVFVISGLMFCAYLSRLHNGGYLNVLMPAYFAVAMGTSVGLSRILKSDKVGLHFMAGFLIFLQLVICTYNPSKYLPSKTDIHENQRIIRLLRKSPSEVWVPHHSYLTFLADKPPHAHILALVDVKQNDRSSVSLKLETQLVKKIEEQKFSLVLLDEYDRFGLREAFLQKKYQGIGKLFLDSDKLIPKSGYITRPQWIFLPIN